MKTKTIPKKDRASFNMVSSMGNQLSTWKGSPHTAGMVAAQIQQRWGDEEVKKYDPKENCFTLLTWNMKGYKVKKGEKALKSITFKEIEKVDKDTKEITESYKIPRNVSLFYYLQVELKANKII